MNVEPGGTHCNQRVNKERQETEKCTEVRKSPYCSESVGNTKQATDSRPTPVCYGILLSVKFICASCCLRRLQYCCRVWEVAYLYGVRLVSELKLEW